MSSSTPSASADRARPVRLTVRPLLARLACLRRPVSPSSRGRLTSPVGTARPARQLTRRVGVDGGMVTAETALAVPSVVLVLGLCLAGLQAGVDRVRCVDAARVAVRELARGETPGRAVSDAIRAAPAGSTVRVTTGAAEVSAEVQVPAPAGLAGFVDAGTCRAVARVEDTAG